jgi:uncharacterized protein YndB with AHSA1/START domain
MSAKNSAALAAAMPSDRELVLTRVFDAPRELVWKAWTDPQHVIHWWGPNGFTTTLEEMDIRPGGVWKQIMHGPDGTDYPSKSVFLEVLKPERLSYSHVGGKKGAPSADFETTVTFEDLGGKTKLTLRTLFPSGEARDLNIKTYGAVEGGNQTLARLADYLPGMQQKTFKTILIAEPGKPISILERFFDAPRQLVFEAYTNPNHIPRWWGLRTLATTVDKMDVRPGGVWRYVQCGQDGKEFAFSGVYREILPPERIVSTFKFEAMPGHVVLNTATFEELDGKTKVTVTSEFQTVEDRDGMIKSGMERGANESWDMLDEHLSKMATQKVSPAQHELVLTRVFDAPRTLVFQAWTDPQHLAQWWGPHGFTNPVCELDARPGGAILIHMRAPNGVVYPMKAVFQELVPPERLVFLSGAMDDKGNLLFEVLNTVTFAEQAGKTTLTLHARVVKSTAAAAPYLAGMEIGWTQSLERLAAFVANA